MDMVICMNMTHSALEAAQVGHLLNHWPRNTEQVMQAK